MKIRKNDLSSDAPSVLVCVNDEPASAECNPAFLNPNPSTLSKITSNDKPQRYIQLFNLTI